MSNWLGGGNKKAAIALAEDADPDVDGGFSPPSTTKGSSRQSQSAKGQMTEGADD